MGLMGRFVRWAIGLCGLLMCTTAAAGAGGGSAFTYQGRLVQAGVEINELADFQFRLYDASSGGTQIGSTLSAANVDVTDGLFTVDLDFGSVFDGTDLWLEIDVRVPAGGGAYTTLTPRQPIMPAPYALHATSAGSVTTVPDGALVGAYSSQVSLNNSGNSYRGDGSALTGLSYSQLGGTVPGAALGGTYTGLVNLTHAENTFVGSFSGNGGLLTNLNWNSLINVPAGFADGIDNDTIVWSTSGGVAYYNAGNVGIGTNSPFQKLHVAGNAQFDGALLVDGGLNADGDLRILNGAGFGVDLARSFSNTQLRVWDATAFQVLTGTDPGAIVTRFHVEPDGDIGIGTTAPQFDLHVNGTAGKPGGGLWSTASDRRLKQNIQPLRGALDRVLALRGVTFEYIDPEAIGEFDGERIGLIAQEVEQVFPDWVSESDDGYKRVAESGTTALFIEALRELRVEKDRQIAARDREIKSLRAELAELRALVEQIVSTPQ